MTVEEEFKAEVAKHPDVSQQLVKVDESHEGLVICVAYIISEIEFLISEIECAQGESEETVNIKTLASRLKNAAFSRKSSAESHSLRLAAMVASARTAMHIAVDRIRQEADQERKALAAKLEEAERRYADCNSIKINLEAKLETRAREHNPSDPIVRAKVLALTDGKCAYCDCEISSESDDGKDTFIVEHVVPKSAGGPDHLNNYVPACPSCNSSKHAGHVVEFIRRRVA